MFVASLTLLLALPAAATSPKSKDAHSKATGPSSHARHGKKTHRAARGSWKHRGQQQISADRVKEIQTALIREHYLTGEPTGIFDQRTKNALMKLQADQGWQSKVVPDSRALIKLGLGPTHDGAINLEANSEKNALLKTADSAPVPQN